MKILAYRDLPSKDGAMPLMDHAFRWVFNQREFEDTVKIDPRMKDGPVGFFAVEGDQIIGYVGVNDLMTRALDGAIEPAGGLYGVATLPGHTRKGVSTALINVAHQYFRKKGYRFSFLFTSRALVAHGLYVKLGYCDAMEFPSVYKLIRTKKAKSSSRTAVYGFDVDEILRIYNEFCRNRTCLVLRNKAYVRMLKKAVGITARRCIVHKDGYAVFKEDKSGIGIRELVALNAKEANRLLDELEKRTKGLVYSRDVLDQDLLRVYRSRGYIVQERSHAVMMIKTLSSNVSSRQVYGDNLFLGGLDAF